MKPTPSPQQSSPSPFGPTPDLWEGVHRPVAYKLEGVAAMVTRIREMAVTCQGSRSLQETVKQANDNMLREMTEAVCPDTVLLADLCMDKFGNYFIQVLLNAVGSRGVARVLHAIRTDPGLLSKMAVHMYASHVVQLLISLCAKDRASSLKLVDGLAQHVAEVGDDFLGSICLVHAIKTLPTANKLVTAVAVFTKELSLTRHGYLVVVEALERASSQTLGNMERVIGENLDVFVENEFAFRVVKHALELEKNGRVNPKYSRVRMLTKKVKFNYNYFKLIDVIMTNFIDDEVVRTELLPAVMKIVETGQVPVRGG